MMDVVVFVGPSLSSGEVRRHLPDARILPPCGQGDVVRCVEDGARAIAIVDGYFHLTPAVWHHEIMWAMARGVYVFGSSSMGALRAAELAPYGMTGVGVVFERYRSGTYVDDDFVAVVHAGAEHGYAPASDPMVNIVATLDSARAQALISERVAADVEEIARRTFYMDRTWRGVLEDAQTRGLPRREIARLAAWAERNFVDQKARDAEQMLGRMRLMWAAGGFVAPYRPDFDFRTTSTWRDAFEASVVCVQRLDNGGWLTVDDVLAECVLFAAALPAPIRDGLREYDGPNPDSRIEPDRMVQLYRSLLNDESGRQIIRRAADKAGAVGDGAGYRQGNGEPAPEAEDVINRYLDKLDGSPHGIETARRIAARSPDDFWRICLREHLYSAALLPEPTLETLPSHEHDPIARLMR